MRVEPHADAGVVARAAIADPARLQATADSFAPRIRRAFDVARLPQRVREALEPHAPVVPQWLEDFKREANRERE